MNDLEHRTTIRRKQTTSKTIFSPTEYDQYVKYFTYLKDFLAAFCNLIKKWPFSKEERGYVFVKEGIGIELIAIEHRQ
jgi:hypothetical protein